MINGPKTNNDTEIILADIILTVLRMLLLNNALHYDLNLDDFLAYVLHILGKRII
jgi:hypothetical protein